MSAVAASPFVAQLDPLPIRSSFIDKISSAMRIFFTDILPSIVTCTLPNALRWVWHSWITRTIRSYSIEESSQKAQLFAHGKLPRLANQPTRAVLLLHGDHAHPYSMLHLADIAKEKNLAVFSLHLPYNDQQPQIHQRMLLQAINRIDQLIRKKGGSSTHLVVAGHSRGALEAAHAAYVENAPHISSVIAIAGRFRVITPSTRPCRPSLQPSVQIVSERLSNFAERLRVPFFQIAATKDWCMDPEASIARTDYPHCSIDAGHAGVVCHPQTLALYKQWIAA